ncbi:MAG: tryptophan--tRNA ligase [Oscillospiraceae bacterium]|nr:tryptophan--tRNA ligase [Oscillospiraceae bacterium]
MRKRVFSGVQPTGRLTFGNYSTMRHWPKLADDHDCIYCVVDLHSVTITRKPEELRNETRKVFAALLALGIDPDRDIPFIQSHVPAHSELMWLLGCHTMFGELSRMTQFKDKSARHATNVNVGLFTYPVLQAADILLYDAHFVPVGEDQRQHVELSRDICLRFNGRYGDVLTVPEPLIKGAGARVMSLSEPSEKMSKSDPNENATLFVTDGRDTIVKKIKRAVTDSDGAVRYDTENKPGVANLMTLYHISTDKPFGEIEREFDGRGYGVFKAAVAEAVADCLTPVGQRLNEYLSDAAQLDALARRGAEKASERAVKTLERVYNAMGFYKC